MDEPSAKRQKVSLIEGSENNDAQPPTKSQPTTPTSRASYQSPTKASLARSHPALLARSPGRASQTRGRNLRMSLLANRNATGGENQNNAASIQAPHTPRRGTSITANAPTATDENGPEGFSAAVARAFADNRLRTSVRSPLTVRQPSASEGPPQNESDDGEKSALVPFMRPKLVSRTSSFNGNDITLDTSSEPELPPTPVQLGLEPPPERPRGLGSSSSPRGSKGGTRRSRRRENAVASSPLKPRDKAPEERASPLPGAIVPMQVDVEVADEAPESDVEEPAFEERNFEASDIEDDHDTIPEEIKEKQSLRRDLRAELAQLKSDLRRLETAVDPSIQVSLDPKTFQILTTTTTATPARPESPTPCLPNPITLPSNPLAHLTLFAPGSLKLSTSTSTTKPSPTSSTIYQIHTLVITPPSPYPPHIFGAVLTVHTNPLTTQIEKVELTKWHSQHAPLKKWVDARLTSPLHRLDVAGLIWGLGSYWEFCVTRGKTWEELNKRWRGGDRAARTDPTEQLVGLLKREKMELPIPGKDNALLLLTWKGGLSWTGSVEERIGLSAKALPEKAHKLVAGLFEGVRVKRGVVGAVEGVVSVLGNGKP